MYDHEDEIAEPPSPDDVKTRPIPVIGLDATEETSDNAELFKQQPEQKPFDASIDGLSPEELRHIDVTAAGIALGLEQSGVPDELRTIKEKLSTITEVLYTLPAMIEARVAAGVETALDRHAKGSYVPPPDPFREHFMKLLLVLQLVLPSVIWVTLFGTIVTGMVLGWASPSSWVPWLVLPLISVAYAVVWAVLYIRWRVTYIVCDENGTGVSRRRIPWICTRLQPKLSTSKIDIKEAVQGYLTSSLKINWWRVMLWVPSQTELIEKPTGAPDLVLRFVKNGDQLINTIGKFQSHFRSIG